MSRTRHRQKRRSWSRTLLLLVFLSAALYAGVYCLFRAPDQKQEESSPVQTVNGTSQEPQGTVQQASSHHIRKPDFYTILVSGMDDGNGLNDTNILVAVDAANNYIYGVSIPRDSKAVWDSKSHKINAVYNAGGMEKLADVVSDQLGIPVDYTVLVDLQGFEALVDAIGGVDFYIPIDMDYDDPYQDLSIHFTKGMRHLYGADAMKVVRFRHNNDGTGYPNGDLGRIETQHAFFAALARQVLQLGNISNLPQIISLVIDNTDTNLSSGNIAFYAQEFLKMGMDDISFYTLPYDTVYIRGGSYVSIQLEAWLDMINTYLNPFNMDVTAANLDVLCFDGANFSSTTGNIPDIYSFYDYFAG